MQKIRILIFLLVLLSCPILVMSQSSKPFEVIILHTNDMHSKIDNMARLAYLADSLRAINADVFLVSDGDNFTGNPVVDMVSDIGYPMIDLMNRCRFDISALGNHEFDMGQTFLNKRMAQARFPFICCNLDVSKAELKPVSPYVILKTKSGVEIPFLGIIQIDENGLPSSHPSKMKGITFFNGLDKAREFAWLKARYGMLIGVSHLGVEDDVRLAGVMPELDVIFGGHSHTLIENPMVENGVTIVQAGSNLIYVGKTTIVISNNRIVSIRDTLIALKDIRHEDAGISESIRKYNDISEFNRVIGYASKPFNGRDELGSLMTDALTSRLKTDFAFQNKGGIRVTTLDSGDISLKDIYKLDPFNNVVVVFNMTPAEIGSLICYGYNLMKGIDLQVSGMTYQIKDPGDFQCASVDMRDLSGRALDSKKEYSVAINGYMATTYKFDHKDPGRSTEVTTNQALIDFLKQNRKIDYSGTIRATVVK